MTRKVAVNTSWRDTTRAMSINIRNSFTWEQKVGKMQRRYSRGELPWFPCVVTPTRWIQMWILLKISISILQRVTSRYLRDMSREKRGILALTWRSRSVSTVHRLHLLIFSFELQWRAQTWSGLVCSHDDNSSQDAFFLAVINVQLESEERLIAVQGWFEKVGITIGSR